MISLEEYRQVRKAADLLYPAPVVEQAISRLAAEITGQLAGSYPLVLTVLNGGIIFAGKLLSQLDFALEIDSIQATRYRGNTEGGEVVWLKTPEIELRDRTVLLLDDILDEGITLAHIVEFCEREGARQVKTATLIEKKIGRDKPVTADFVGLETDNRYLFGYGLDYKNALRNAPGIYACKE
ncbi:hypoxanthine-guanine phosphoribosyltransferase [Candidatus Methylospira mobilis]|uniref:Hypoxanthine-guanine phosphoribosyltransferase n=1 Tax=Candidatus Methylospira mobilis TaxID=1808979 RepID=A0A5Q0BJ38_9GAMM|nr:hypoxanthine-guanine phosphoribosyltransferase [Candidatus Methylospira mobilis]QFY43579.1 hypoxanthine-guanine phosphoribosyltransferase [Candidatus Methylospira mobilis]WNV03880.1 hypoxanthine-guanine phosphoribosyltransferase [Candidatus Methylospira mobilis]